MFRPATPLAVILFAAFALLVLSVLSTPVIKAIPLGSFQGVNFGVFGFCKADGSCSSFELGYDTSSLFSSTDSATFDLPASARHTLSTILILHPIAAFLTLVMLVMAFAAHFHSPSHSVRYLLFVFIVSIFTFLAALLAFLIDVLLFVPHMAWGSFITLAAACLIAVCSIVSCAMRRTLVSRKSRQRRIEDNAEMSGENFYNRQAQEEAAATAASKVTTTSSSVGVSRQPTLPQIGTTSAIGGDSFEKRDDVSSDEQVPLTSRTVPPAQRYGQSPVHQDQYGNPRRQDSTMMSGAAGGPPRRPSRPDSVQRDGYGNPLPYSSSRTPPPMDGYGAGMRRGPSAERMNNMSPRGRGGPPYRGGRGGPGPYGPQGRGGYGPMPGRGGYGPPGRSGTGGGYGGGYGGPMPPNGRGRGYGGPMGRGGYSGGPNRGGRTPPPGYQYDQPGSYGARNQSPAPQNGPGAYLAANSAAPAGPAGPYEPYRERTVSGDLPRAESPPPLGGDAISPAVEMDAGMPRSRQQGGRFGDDEDIAGMVGLQQDRTSNAIPERNSENMDGQYVPPRAAWSRPGTDSPSRQMPAAAELSSAEVAARPRTSEQYIEDVDPRFAEPVQPRQQVQPLLPTNNSYEDVHQGSRSPAESDRSNFTSISQRGINPRWNPPPPTLMPSYSTGSGGGHVIPRRPVRDVNETLLNSNPDFSLPTGRQPAGGIRGAGLGGAGGGAYPAL